MSITQLKQALELNTKLLQETSELKAWSDLMIQRQKILYSRTNSRHSKLTQCFKPGPQTAITIYNKERSK